MAKSPYISLYFAVFFFFFSLLLLNYLLKMRGYAQFCLLDSNSLCKKSGFLA